MKTVTFNADTQLYCIPCGNGFTCLGYKVAYDRAYRLRNWLIAQNLPIPSGIPDEPMERYTYLKELQAIAKNHYEKTGVRCDAELHPLLIGHEGERARYTDENGKRKSFIVGKSAGWMPCHLSIARRNSSGGYAIGYSDRFPSLTFEKV